MGGDTVEISYIKLASSAKGGAKWAALAGRSERMERQI